MLLSSIFTKGALSLAMAALPVVTSTGQITNPAFFSKAKMAIIEPAGEEFVHTTSTSEVASPPAPAPEAPVKTMRVSMTAYSSTPDQTDATPFHTANGTHVRDGIVAANFLPFHTRIRLPELYGDKVFVVEDRMHARYSKRVDVWMESRAAAKQFGYKRSALIEILPPEAQVALAK